MILCVQSTRPFIWIDLVYKVYKMLTFGLYLSILVWFSVIKRELPIVRQVVSCWPESISGSPQDGKSLG